MEVGTKAEAEVEWVAEVEVEERAAEVAVEGEVLTVPPASVCPPSPFLSFL